jgi:hypothetical protein
MTLKELSTRKRGAVVATSRLRPSGDHSAETAGQRVAPICLQEPLVFLSHSTMSPVFVCVHVCVCVCVRACVRVCVCVQLMSMNTASHTHTNARIYTHTWQVPEAHQGDESAERVPPDHAERPTPKVVHRATVGIPQRGLEYGARKWFCSILCSKGESAHTHTYAHTHTRTHTHIHTHTQKPAVGCHTKRGLER